MIQQRLPGLTADITRSRVIHKILSQDTNGTDKVLALEHREIVSQAPVSLIAPYHTALIVVAAASAFIICVLTLLVILYRRKVSQSSCFIRIPSCKTELDLLSGLRQFNNSFLRS